MTGKNLSDFENAKEYIEYIRNNKTKKENKPMTESQLKMEILKKSEDYINQMLKNVGLSRDNMYSVCNLQDDFSLTGNAGGQFVFYKDWQVEKDVKLRWNLYVAEHNTNEYLNQVVAHEVAHFIVEILYRLGKISFRDRGNHGRIWKRLMISVDLPPEIYHTFQTVRGKTTKRFDYSAECGCTFKLSTIMHNKIQRGKTKRVCGKHKKYISWDGTYKTFEAGTKY